MEELFSMELNPYILDFIFDNLKDRAAHDLAQAILMDDVSADFVHGYLAGIDFAKVNMRSRIEEMIDCEDEDELEGSEEVNDKWLN